MERSLTTRVGNASDWLSPPTVLQRGAQEAHVWLANVATLPLERSDGATILDEEELDRAARFHFERDRRQYIGAHVLLRTVLAGYTGRAPGSLTFRRGPAGKPSLEATGDSLPVQFNLSHSGDLILLAVAGTAVGVDIERWSTDVETDAVAGQFFSPAECRELMALAPADRMAGFFACWSRKEAYIKATGLGVTAGLDYFDVVVDARCPASLLADRRSPDAERHWRMLDLDVGPGYSAAIVVDAATYGVRRYAYVEGEPLTVPGGPW